MSTNPPDSDGRRTSHGAVDDPDVETLRSRIAAETDPASPLDGDHVKELLLLESGTDLDDLERPYLERLPDAYAGRLTLFEWLDFLLDVAGVRRTLDAIDYYVNVGWIDDAVAADIRDHVRAFREIAPSEGTRDLETADHVVSLVYVARLASMT